MVRLPNTATFGELLARAREKRHGALELEGPVYGRDGELDTTLRDGWVRNSCKVDGTLHIGLAVVVSFPRGSQRSLSLTMGPGATIGDVKQRICVDHGIVPSRQGLMICGGAQRLGANVTLKECCVWGVPVGGFSPKGWGELRLELHVAECTTRNSLQVAMRDSSQGWSASEFRGAVGVGLPSRGTDVLRSPSQPSHLTPSPPVAATYVPQNNEGSSLTTPSSLHRNGASTVETRPTVEHGSGPYSTVMFALSPSGRALTLTMAPTATVLDAKTQVAAFEGVSPCRQRLLWRGILMEPDGALLRRLGARGGDTLIVGYRVGPGAPPEVMRPVVELEGNAAGDDDAQNADAAISPTHSPSHHRPCGAQRGTVDSSGSSNIDGGIPEQGTSGVESAAAVADGDENNDVVAPDGGGGDGGGGGSGMDVDEPAGAWVNVVRNGGVDVVDGAQRGSGSGEAEQDGNASGATSSPPSEARSGSEKSGGQRAWWAKRMATRSLKGSRSSNEQGWGATGATAALRGAVGASSLSASTPSADSTNNSADTRRVRVSPTPAVPVHQNATHGVDRAGVRILRGIGAGGASSMYDSPPSSAAARRQQRFIPSVGRPKLKVWARWKYGRRVPTPPVPHAGDGGGRG
ncbi:hypothetical protein Esi_0216_0050 [Ectocarpus siliculosus]|uniref:Ubiquitin-like domain-containing protein n=1 Tax=Ectocarpus siliculosus TaxID=2880 RepID=D7FRN3_ECTSI|nr:hypothetical protein Esi_0216_0050 [Ectocarpus siliculosus]|eukprot:CBJ30824.1 hypothetical protein Esi_0216_0050 [Ectocarpus siliculosus]